MRRGIHDMVFVVYFPGASLLRLFPGGRKVFMDIRTGSDRPHPLRFRLENILLVAETRMFPRLSIVSASLSDFLGFPPGRCTVLPLGGDRLDLPQKTYDDLRLFYVGTLDQREIEKTVEGLGLFWKETGGRVAVAYDIVGSGPPDQEAAVHAAIAASPCASRIQFHGRIPNTELRPFLERANVGVAFIPLKEYYQCQPSTKVFEYLLAGIPVLATRTRENQAVVNDSNGALCDESAEGFARGLREIWDRRATYNADALRGGVLAYDWETIVKSTLRTHLLAHDRRARPLPTATRKVPSR
jgi:glycosyltransferase involved in cell wall biosynthesis